MIQTSLYSEKRQVIFYKTKCEGELQSWAHPLPGPAPQLGPAELALSCPPWAPWVSLTTPFLGFSRAVSYWPAKDSAVYILHGEWGLERNWREGCSWENLPEEPHMRWREEQRTPCTVGSQLWSFRGWQPQNSQNFRSQQIPQFWAGYNYNYKS